MKVKLIRLSAIILGIIGIGVLAAYIGENGMKDSKNEVEQTSSTDEDSSTENIESISDKSDSEEDEHYEINFTPDEFEEHYNEEAVNLLGEDSLNIHVKVKEGEKENLMIYDFDNGISLIGGVDKDSFEITNLMLIKQGEIDKKWLSDYYKIISVLMNVFNPQMTKEDRGNLLFVDLDADNVIINHEVKKKLYHGLEYSLNYSNEKLGLLFSVSIPEE